MKKLLVFAVALVVAAGCSSMKISNDYDRQADFSQYKTYAWHDSDTNVADTDPFAHERFIGAVDRQLAAKGFSKASSNPDVYVTYHAEDEQGMSLNTNYMGRKLDHYPFDGELATLELFDLAMNHIAVDEVDDVRFVTTV